MSHEITKIDRVGLQGTQAWHRLGVVIEEELSAIDAAERFGLTWPVVQFPLFAKMPDGSELEVPTHVANVRTKDQDGNDIRHLLGVVGADYAVCQNRELAEFTDALAQTGQVTIESCGSVCGGKRVWFLARGDAFDIGGKDKVWPYVLVSNGHDGGQAIRITPTTIRVVCSNTLHMVIPQTDEAQAPEQAAYVIRHSGKISDKLQQARLALRHYDTVRQRNAELFEKLAGRQMDRDDALKRFAGVYAAHWETATDEELRSPDTETRRTAHNRLRRMHKAVDAFLRRYQRESARVGLSDNACDTARVERRIESNLFGLNVRRTMDTLAAFMAT